MEWNDNNGLLLIPLGLGWLSVWGLMPAGRQRPRILGGLAALAALLMLQQMLLPPAGDVVRNVLFYLFASSAVIAAGLMVTDPNPVYSALWFALTTMAVCGLFVLSSAPFLAASTIIVYAGAIIVVFLFVIMLANQSGADSSYDLNPSQPAFASLGAFILLGALLFSLQDWKVKNVTAEQGRFIAVPEALHPNPLSQAPVDNPHEIGSLRVLGRSLFGDYLYAVEMAGTVLLIATIGAIAIAPRKSQGTL
ncbi:MULTISPECIES: NADH-quinone oxidoreductase subunit J [unclassified Schlesneria]|uniref:NADH-quinone oxidoreductase subunit J family protein n=1 Tax=Schlesneria TaxID=656899 RepID=UPI002F0E70BF